jgi:hypothetical protein
MRTLALLTAMMIALAVAATLAIKPFTPAAHLAVSPSPTISIGELHRLVDLRLLPELEIEDLV